MIDYLLDLLEAVEEVGVETAELSLPQKEERYLRRQGGREEREDVARTEAAAKKAVEEEMAVGSMVDWQEPRERREDISERAEEVLEKKLGASWRGVTENSRQRSREARVQDAKWGGLRPGAYLLEGLQQGNRMAELGGGGRVTHTTPQVMQQGERVAQGSFADFAAFDLAVERDARCYDNGFSLF